MQRNNFTFLPSQVFVIKRPIFAVGIESKNDASECAVFKLFFRASRFKNKHWCNVLSSHKITTDFYGYETISKLGMDATWCLFLCEINLHVSFCTVYIRTLFHIENSSGVELVFITNLHQHTKEISNPFFTKINNSSKRHCFLSFNGEVLLLTTP